MPFIAFEYSFSYYDWRVGTVRDYHLTAGSDSAASDDGNRTESASPRRAEEPLLIPPPRPPPPRVSPHRREHSLLPPALPPKERHGGVTSLTDSLLSRFHSSDPVPPPLPQPRQRRKEPSLASHSRSTVACRLANKAAPPPLPADRDSTDSKTDAVSAPLLVHGNVTQSGGDDRHPLHLGLGPSLSSLKSPAAARVPSESRLADDTAVASSTLLSLDAAAAAAECSVCLERPVDCVLYTCGHMCLCYECAVSVYHASVDGGSCPICRQAIKDVIKIYRS